MHNQAPIPLAEENLDALKEKHGSKIDTAVGNDSKKQQDRLRLFDHDPTVIAAHYPELQKKSEELREQNLAIQKTAAVAGWGAFLATAAATGYAAFKGKITDNKLIQGIVVLLTSITAGFAANFSADRLLGARNRQESKDLATASRIAYERELAPYMEDTEQRLRKAAEEEKQSPPAQQSAGKEWAKAVPAPAEGHVVRAEQTKAANADTVAQRA